VIIDTHTHFYDPSRPEGVPWPPADNDLLYRTVLPAHHRALAEPEGVTGTVVVEASAWVADNQWILDLAAADPWILGLVGHLDPGTADFARHLDEFGDHPSFVGIRVGGRYFGDIGSGGFLADMEKLADRDLELDVIMGVEEWDGLCGLARELPELRMVVNHVAHVSIDGNPPDPHWAECMYRAAEFPRIYCKVSALVELSKLKPAPAEVEYYEPTLDVLWDAFGEDRLVYGSNWPVCEVGGDYAAVLGIARAYFEAKGEEAAAKYWWRNARAAYQLPGVDG
jgi:L-fuconolactonase